MKRYLNHMHTKPTHERRQHAMRVAGVVTALVFAGWVTTLGLQLGTSDAAPVANGTSGAAQTAAAINNNNAYQGNQLIVSTSTSY